MTMVHPMPVSTKKSGDEVPRVFPAVTLSERASQFRRNLDELADSPKYPKASSTFSVAMLCWGAYVSEFPVSEGKVDGEELVDWLPKAFLRLRNLLEQVGADSLDDRQEVGKMKQLSDFILSNVEVLQTKGKPAAIQMLQISASSKSSPSK